MAPSFVGRWFSQNVWMPDEELAKKDDDLKLPHHNANVWRASRTPRRRAVMRYGVYALVCLCLLLVLRRVAFSREEDIVRPFSQTRHNAPTANGVPTQLTAPKPTPEIPAIKSKADDLAGNDNALAANARNYKGVLKFNALGSSLRQLLSSPGVGRGVSSVLFAASNLQSAATVLPMACQRAASQQDRVFFALFGDSDIELEKLLKVNSIDEYCKIMSIDARADQRQQLSNSRLALAAARAMHYIASYVNPAVVIVDGSSTEDGPFLDGIKDQLVDMPRTTLIELPDRAQSRVSWISQLDATALTEWNNAHFDILIHAPPTGTGNIKRLLRSLAAADLSGHTIPQITLELPPTLDTPLERFLDTFQWPRPRFAGSSPNMLNLRHRIQHTKSTASESTVRLLESFWPKNAATSHVLILSPHTEVSPQFFHYVKYALLHRHYGKNSSEDDPSSLMFGISFTVPETNLHDSNQFSAPSLPLEKGGEVPSATGTSFVWQAPSSDAILIFGDKWVELHGYVSQSLEIQRADAAVPAMMQSREVAENHPAWLEYMLQLCRLRGYFTMYPSKETADAVVGVYADLPDVPDGREKSEADARPVSHRGSSFDAGSQVDMLNTLKDGGSQPSIQTVPVLAWDGKVKTIDEMVQESHKQAAEFRRQIGKCDDPETSGWRDKLARDLFCVVLVGE